MPTKTNKTASNKTASDKDSLKKLVTLALEYAQAMETVTDLKAKSEKLREQMMPILKANEHVEWKVLGKDIKELLIDANVPDVTGKLGVFKTCFEHKVMPISFNADRFRKLKSWVSWSGLSKPNTYTPKHKKPAAIPADTPASTLPAQAAPVAKGKPKVPAGTDTTKKAVSSTTAADGTGSEQALKPSELWNSQFQAFVHNPLTPVFIETLAALLVVEKSKLTAAMTTAASDLLKQAAKQNV